MQSAQAFFTVHNSPSSFLQAALPHLLRYQRKFNVILPHAQKLHAQERSGAPLASGQFWVIGWSLSPSSSSSSPVPTQTLEFVLSCTEHHLGTYPLFLVFTRDIPPLSDDWIDVQMKELAHQLSNLVAPTRVFSIFGQEKPTLALCRHWSSISGARIVLEPYYEASSSYCTKTTLVKKKDAALSPGHEMRLAIENDLAAVAQLCQEFAEDSPPFTLTTARAIQEAQYLITHGLVSVYAIDGQITTIVAVTRKTETVAGMTKVYTTPKFRGRGCAERLVAHVCEQQLTSGKESVVLFVGHALSAARVYHRVGFVGVGAGKTSDYIPDAERWIELGFEGADIGHW